MDQQNKVRMDQRKVDLISSDDFTLTIEEDDDNFLEEPLDIINAIVSVNSQINTKSILQETDVGGSFKYSKNDPFNIKIKDESKAKENSDLSYFDTIKKDFEKSRNFIPISNSNKQKTSTVKSDKESSLFNYYMEEGGTRAKITDFISQPSSPILGGTNKFTDSKQSINSPYNTSLLINNILEDQLHVNKTLANQTFNNSFDEIINTNYNNEGYDILTVQREKTGWVCCKCNNFNYESKIITK